MVLVKEKTNPWLYEKLKKVNPPELGLVIEVEHDYTEQVASELEALNIKVKRELISWGRYIPIVALPENIPEIQRIPHVRAVHYEMPRYPYQMVDPLLGEIRISRVEVPLNLPEAVITSLPILPFGGPLGIFLPFVRPGVEAWPTGRTREIIGAPRENTVTTRVAVLDTGSPLPSHPLRRFRHIEEISTTGEAPLDGLGHGVWCHTCAFLGEAPTGLGDVKSVADAMNSIHVKCLSNLGFGSTTSVLKAMEAAYKWGAKVVSMSLGGPLQGGVDEDPECRIVQETGDEVFWVVAAGNSGPNEWTIGSPAAAPKALTVGAYSPKYEDVSIYSSRGPSAQWYKENPDAWTKDYAKYGENLIKPDVLAPGGGPVEKDQEPVDLIYSGGQGWTDGVYDSPFDAFTLMRGTSMACPHASGLAVLLYERKGYKTTGEIKSVMGEAWGKVKDIARGYGLMYWDKF